MKKIFFVLLCIVLFYSCSTQKNIVYLQDSEIGVEVEPIKGGEIKLKPNDVISIYVSSKTPELASVFNLYRGGSQSSSSSSITSSLSGSTSNASSHNYSLSYTVDSDGNIDFPLFGAVKVEGLTKQDVVMDIKSRILESGMLKDPIVTVDFVNLKFSTLGEVAKPGNYAITRDQTTILDALSLSGDLTIYGERDKVFLTRKVDDNLVTYQLDLKSKSIFQSPAYFVQQDDVIYVAPNKIRTNQSTVNGNTVRSTSFWMSLASFITTIVVLIAN